MRIVLKSISRSIDEAIDEALANNRQVDRIEVSIKEYKALTDEIQLSIHYTSPDSAKCYYRGYALFIIENGEKVHPDSFPNSIRS